MIPNSGFAAIARTGTFMFLLLILAGCNGLTGRVEPTTIATSPTAARSSLPQVTPGADKAIGISGEVKATLSTPIQAARPMPTTTDRWLSLMLVTPYPWSTVVPPYRETSVDGTYAKFDPGEPQWWNCLRCEDFIPAGGIWRLQLEKGIYRIYYEVTEWRSLGSFSLSGERILLFNDPHCRNVTGEYRWQLEDGALTFEVIEDECAIGLRAANLTKQAWLSCTPPDVEAAISDHWVKPEGCVD